MSLKAAFRIDEKKREIQVRESPLLDWMTRLSLSEKSSEKSRKKGWEDFPVEALFGTPTRYAKWAAGRKPSWENPRKPRRVSVSGDSSSLTLLGHEFLRLVRRREGEAENTPFRVVLESYSDLRVIRTFLGSSADQLEEVEAPFCMMGEWAHTRSESSSLELSVAATLWADKDLRKEALTWIKNGGDGQCCPFLLGLPPLSSYAFELTGVFKKNGDFWEFEDVDLEVRLPHLARGDVVSGIPSAMVLRNNSVRNHLCETLLVASPHLRATVARMSELWHDPTLRTVLLIAPPGSGKEVLAHFLHAGSVYYDENDAKANRNLQKASFAGDHTIEEIRKTLFGRIMYGGQKGTKVNDGMWRGGLVQEARGTTVLLDEVDKWAPASRGALLRFIENDEVHPLGADTPFNLENEWLRHLKPRLVFAGSLPRPSILALQPADFWTRIQLVIETVHPLEIHDPVEKRQCIEEYFMFFLYRSLDNKNEYERIPGFDVGERDAFKQHLRCVLGKERWGNGESDAWTTTVSDNQNQYPYLYFWRIHLLKLSKHVSSFLAQFPSAAISVRNLRSIVKQIDYRIELYVTRGLDVLAHRAPADQKPNRAGGGADKDDSKADDEIPDNLKEALTRMWIWKNLHDITQSLLR